MESREYKCSSIVLLFDLRFGATVTVLFGVCCYYIFGLPWWALLIVLFMFRIILAILFAKEKIVLSNSYIEHHDSFDVHYFDFNNIKSIDMEKQECSNCLIIKFKGGFNDYKICVDGYYNYTLMYNEIRSAFNNYRNNYIK